LLTFKTSGNSPPPPPPRSSVCCVVFAEGSRLRSPVPRPDGYSGVRRQTHSGSPRVVAGTALLSKCHCTLALRPDLGTTAHPQIHSSEKSWSNRLPTVRIDVNLCNVHACMHACLCGCVIFPAARGPHVSWPRAHFQAWDGSKGTATVPDQLFANVYATASATVPLLV
jgi:hypothetical protein